MKKVSRILASLIVFAAVLFFPIAKPSEADTTSLPQYALNVINLPITYHLTRGDGTRVAILDSGVASHPEYDRSFAFGLTYPGFTSDIVDSHGSYIAGIIGSQGSLIGVAPATGILSFKVYHNYITDDSLSWGIERAIENNVDVINMSLASAGTDTTYHPKTVASIQKAISKGIIVVISAGNNSCDCPRWLPTLPGVISVGSVDKNGTISGFSNYGDWVDVYAPGTAILTTLPPNRYNTVYGTSFSTPYVVGVAALAKSIKKDLTPAEFKILIKQTSSNKIMDAGKLLYTLKKGYYSYYIPTISTDSIYSIR